ncbi:ribulose-phosphate 3-epimerase, partial [Streptococcus danieliae]|nr:ribulose-phosphate 3-epimerase [Streptococcus danieliae]
KYEKKVGIALNPATSLDVLDYVIDEIDLILIMSVNPGVSGQQFMKKIKHKIAEVCELAKGYQINTSIDGGIDEETIKICLKAGVNIFVVGTYI